MLCGLPRWSPDGKTIAFSGQAPAQPWRAYLISAEAGSPNNSYPVRSRASTPPGPGRRRHRFRRVCRVRSERQGGRHPHRRSEDPPGDERPGLHRVVLSALVARWPLHPRHDRDYRRLVLFNRATGQWEDLITARSGYPDLVQGWQVRLLLRPLQQRCAVLSRARERPQARAPGQPGRLREAGTGRFGWWTGLGPDDFC